MATLVKKIKVTADRADCTCCDHWLAHWKFKTGDKYPVCANSTCYKEAEVGAHVKKIETNNISHYIVPLCNEHHSVEEVFTVYCELVPAERQETCGK